MTQDSTTPDVTEHHDPADIDDSAPGRRRASRLVVLGAVAGVLLAGLAIGVGLAQSTAERSTVVPQAGSVEVGFAQDMSVHHLQAVTMGNVVRDRATDPAIRQLAFDIASGQLEQVGRMKGWLMYWDQPDQTVGDYMTWMTESGGHPHGGTSMGMSAAGPAAMPGMATAAELGELRSLSGAALDARFLQLMMRHHQGGTEMARYAQEHSGNSAVKALTQSILTSQSAEILQMNNMLTALRVQPLPAP